MSLCNSLFYSKIPASFPVLVSRGMMLCLEPPDLRITLQTRPRWGEQSRTSLWTRCCYFRVCTLWGLPQLTVESLSAHHPFFQQHISSTCSRPETAAVDMAPAFRRLTVGGTFQSAHDPTRLNPAEGSEAGRTLSLPHSPALNTLFHPKWRSCPQALTLPVFYQVQMAVKHHLLFNNNTRVHYY